MLAFLVRVYLLAIGCFGVFRLLALAVMWHHAAALPADQRAGLLLQSLLMGLRFDTVISCYLLAAPLFLLAVRSVAAVAARWISRWIPFVIVILFVPAFFICAADIPYFAQGFGRLNAWSVEWGDNRNFVLGMVTEEFRYWWPVLPFLVVSAVFVWLTFRWKKHLTKSAERPIVMRGALSVLLMGLCFAGIRGRLALKSPIRVGTAYFSKHAFPNELGLNPVFTFIRSYLDRRRTENQPLSLMPDEEAMDYVRGYLPGMGDYPNSIARTIQGADSASKRNVVIVIMESMSAAKTGYLGGTRLTPVLDSLSAQSLSYSRAYTAGIHTYNGIFSTLFSWPSIGMRHPMKTANQVRYDGIASELGRHGYKAIYFTTHDPQFDNVGGFLSSNGFDQIVSQPDYPSGRILSTLGVPDDFMFSFSMPYLEAMEAPFLAVYMTASDHGPYVIPDYFSPRSGDIKQAAVEYADWSIGRFLKEARFKPWFDNTLFVFVADHGAALEYETEMPISYHHTPLLFYAPGFLAPQISDQTALQIDIYPTIMDLLGLPYLNNTFGQSMLRAAPNRLIGFSADERTAVLHPSGHYLVLRPDGGHSVYMLEGFSGASETEQAISPLRVDSMLRHARALPQAADFLVRKRQTHLAK